MPRFECWKQQKLSVFLLHAGQPNLKGTKEKSKREREKKKNWIHRPRTGLLEIAVSFSKLIKGRTTHNCQLFSTVSYKSVTFKKGSPNPHDCSHITAFLRLAYKLGRVRSKVTHSYALANCATETSVF